MPIPSSSLRILSSLAVALLLLGVPNAAGIAEVAWLTRSDGLPGSTSVAIDGDTIVVGSAFDDVDGFERHGSVRVYEAPAGGWNGETTESARLVPPVGQDFAFFGSSVAVDGDVVVVGEPGRSTSTTSAGVLHVYRRPPGGWSGELSPVAILIEPTSPTFGRMGAAVAIEGGTIVAGAPNNLDMGSGTAFVFRAPPGGWQGIVTASARLVPDAVTGIDRFGAAVDVSGSTIVVGAPGGVVLGAPGSSGITVRGRVHVYEEPAGGWLGLLVSGFQAQLNSGTPDDLFGGDVAIDGDTFVVTALGRQRAYVFLREAEWVRRSRLSPAEGAEEQDAWGAGIDLAGDTVFVGASMQLNPEGGTAFVFREPEDGWLGPQFESEQLTSPRNGLGAALALDPRHAVIGAADGAVVYALDPRPGIFHEARRPR